MQTAQVAPAAHRSRHGPSSNFFDVDDAADETTRPTAPRSLSSVPFAILLIDLPSRLSMTTGSRSISH